ncbi:hypothetical protein [Vibrio phage vB_ValS_PJ32]|nr:hypothetical protein [Vibrio phage vB_ValS_PJ32]
MNIKQLLKAQREFSVKAFGDHSFTSGVYKHLLKEIDEVRAAPKDIEEWADCLILALDGAHRARYNLLYIDARINEFLTHKHKGLDKVTTLAKLEKLFKGATEGDIKNVNTWAMFAAAIILVFIKQQKRDALDLFEAVAEKQKKNAARNWGNPDEQDPSKPIEHIRTDEEKARKEAELKKAK